MTRTKGSKNKPKTVTADLVTQIAEKQSSKEALTAEIASITTIIDTLKAAYCPETCDLRHLAFCADSVEQAVKELRELGTFQPSDIFYNTVGGVIG